MEIARRMIEPVNHQSSLGFSAKEEIKSGSFVPSRGHARTIGLNDERCQEEDSHNDEEQHHCWCKCAKHPLLVQMCKSPRKNLQLAYIIPRITESDMPAGRFGRNRLPGIRMREFFAHGG